MIGHYTQGSGLAHNCCRPHREVFNCDMWGTFNILVQDFNILTREPSIINSKNNKRYWFLIINNKYCGWAIRDKRSKQKRQILEVLIKQLLPDYLKSQDLEITLPIKWTEHQIKVWAKDKYWFQGFNFAPVQRADSDLVWKTIDVINWEKRRVLDWGCHYGYMSFEASKKGAIVTGIDKNIQSLQMAKTIRNHIIQQDVYFSTNLERKVYDVILYLSVHHQRDADYSNLKDTIELLKKMSLKHIFIELLLPPTFPKDRKMTEQQINEIVGGKVLLQYKHEVRGVRNIYHIEK